MNSQNMIIALIWLNPSSVKVGHSCPSKNCFSSYFLGKGRGVLTNPT